MATTVNPEDVLVRPQDTPNPLAVKFVLNHSLINDGKATFFSAEESREIPLVESILNIKSVKQVYLFENTTTVTHDGSVPVEDLKACIIAVLKTRMPVHNPQITDGGGSFSDETKKVNKEHENPVTNQIEEILDRTIRPGLQADGGDIEIISFENNELKILYQGACGGCPSAMMGTLDAIQNILRHEIDNEDLIVVPI